MPLGFEVTDAVQDVALLTVQFKVVDWPELIEAGLAERSTVGGPPGGGLQAPFVHPLAQVSI